MAMDKMSFAAIVSKAGGPLYLGADNSTVAAQLVTAGYAVMNTDMLGTTPMNYVTLTPSGTAALKALAASAAPS